MSERIQTLHPDPKKGGPRILRWKYDAVRQAILKLIPKSDPGVPFKELTGGVRSLLGEEVVEKLGSVSWYTVTVKLDLEARGEIVRVSDRGPQRLVRSI
jgi:hypothetical protein